jgi:hypothetical protein
MLVGTKLVLVDVTQVMVVRILFFSMFVPSEFIEW